MERQPVRIEAVVYRANIDGVLSTVVVDDEGYEHMIVGFVIVLQCANATVYLQFYEELPIILW